MSFFVIAMLIKKSPWPLVRKLTIPTERLITLVNLLILDWKVPVYDYMSDAACVTTRRSPSAGNRCSGVDSRRCQAVEHTALWPAANLHVTVHRNCFHSCVLTAAVTMTTPGTSWVHLRRISHLPNQPNILPKGTRRGFINYCITCKIVGFHGGDYEECRLLGYKTPVRTSQETHYVSATESSHLMLCKIVGFHGGHYEECRLLGYKNQFVLHRRHITSPLQSPAS
jgi:hypothetical protein